MSENSMTLIPLTQIGKIIGYKIHLATAHRWRQKGVVHNGEQVKLPVRRIGSRFFVTEDDVRAFIARLNTTSDGNKAITNPRPDANETSRLLDKFKV